MWIGAGALVGLTAVAMAAASAHGMEALGPARLQAVRNGVQMQGWHALALVAVGLWARRGGTLADAAGAAFLLGVILFCGAVYGRALGGWRVGMLAPIGGTTLMIGWLLLAISAFRA